MYWNLSTGAIGIKTDLPGSIELAQRHGFAGVDFSIAEVAELGESRVRHLLDQSKVRLGAWNPPVDWRSDQDTYDQQLRALPVLARLAASLGATRAATWVPPSSKDRPFADNFTFHLNRFRPIAEVLRDHRISLGLEFIGPKTLRPPSVHAFIYDIPGMLELCAAIGTGNVGLLLDCWHWYTSGGTKEDLDRLLQEDVVVVHVNDAPAGLPLDEQLDNQRNLPGETGVIDIVLFLRTLQAMDYAGPVTVEPFSARLRDLSPDTAATETVDSLRKVWRQAGLS